MLRLALPNALGRGGFLRALLVLTAAALAGACRQAPSPPPPPAAAAEAVELPPGPTTEMLSCAELQRRREAGKLDQDETITRPTLAWLSTEQFAAAVRVLLGDKAASAPRPMNTDPFEAMAGRLDAPLPSTLAAWETAAFDAADAAFADAGTRAALLPCEPVKGKERACLEQFTATFGRRAFRRRLDPEELQRWTKVGMEGAKTTGVFLEGVKLVVAGMLQSPQFLVRTVSVDGLAPGERRALSGDEIATRLAFGLTGGPPDDALLALADAGKLSTAMEVCEAARGLLGRPEARDAVVAVPWVALDVERLPQLGKDPTMYPNHLRIVPYMLEETRRLVTEIVWTRNADVRELLDADYTFLAPPLARFYGWPALATGPEDAWRRVRLPAGTKRRGVLGHASVQARYAVATRTSPTKRGRFILSTMLAEQVPPPPQMVNMDTSRTSRLGPTTLRQRMEEHATDNDCLACHESMDDAGFALESFDTVGAERTLDGTLPVDTHGKIEHLGEFKDLPELARMLRKSSGFGAWLSALAFIRLVGTSGDFNLDFDGMKFAEYAQLADFRIKNILLATTMTRRFREVQAPKEAP